MQAILQDRYGDVPEGVLQLSDVAVPSPGDDQVLVRVHAASVDRGTWHVMTGLPYLIRFVGFGVRKPKAPNPGRSFAGTVVSVGSGVSTLAPGDEVYGSTDGAFAENAVAPVDQVARKPGSLSFEQAAGLPISAVAALQAVRDKAQVTAGDRVLVVGASGGVGSFAVQIAKAFGAEVTGVASTGGLDLVRTLGADHVIDYTNDDFVDGEHHYDVIIDTGGHRSLSKLRRALTTRGRLVIVGSETGGRFTGGFGRSIRAGLLSPFVGQKLSMLASSENARDLDALRELVEAGKVVAPVDHVYPLQDTAEAIRRVQDGGARGKVVIAV